MKLIKPSFEIIEQQAGLEGIYKMIELAGRTCYKSEDKITEDSAKKFVDRMIKLGHGATLEFGTVYLYINHKYPNFVKMIDRYINNKYSKCNYFPTSFNKAYISSNLRVLVENNWLNDLKYLCEPTEYHEKRICVKFICDRGILAEFTRHRKFSFMAESTRYCNYSQDKFNNEITYILPSWCNYEEGDYGIISNPKRKNVGNPDGVFHEFVQSLLESEHRYSNLLRDGWKPQQARAVLPNALKTELYMCGFVEDWEHFFELRCAANAHPQARELAIPLKEEFIKRNYI